MNVTTDFNNRMVYCQKNNIQGYVPIFSDGNLLNYLYEIVYDTIPPHILLAKEHAQIKRQESTCSRFGVGACVVADGIKFYAGTNGMQSLTNRFDLAETIDALRLAGIVGFNPSHPLNCKEIGTLAGNKFCRRGKEGVFVIKPNGLPRYYCPSRCAEGNAFRDVDLDENSNKRLELYSDLLPCHKCSKKIIEKGMDEIYISNYLQNAHLDESDMIALDILKQGGVKIVKI